MGLHVRWVAIDTETPQRLAVFWEQLLGWRRVPELDDEGQVGLVPPDGDVAAAGLRGLLLFHAHQPTVGKNRVHLDLTLDVGDETDRDAEVERALALGASRADIGQTGDEPWVVLADPEGNEFCILTPRRS